MSPTCARTRSLCVFVIVLVIMLLGAGSGRADERGQHGQEGGGAVRLLTVIPATACPTCASDKLVVFDIAWQDAATQLFYLADRTNKAIDVINTRTNTYVK